MQSQVFLRNREATDRGGILLCLKEGVSMKVKRYYWALSFFIVIYLLSACRSMDNLQDDTGRNSLAADANVKLGIAFLKQGDLKNAKRKLLSAQRLDSKCTAAWYGMAYFLESTGCYQQAKETYVHAIAIDPISGAAHNNFGAFLCRQGEYEESIKHFLLAVQDPQYLEVGGAYENAGICALKIPDKKRAMGFFVKALTQDPGLTLSAYHLAVEKAHID